MPPSVFRVVDEQHACILAAIAAAPEPGLDNRKLPEIFQRYFPGRPCDAKRDQMTETGLIQVVNHDGEPDDSGNHLRLTPAGERRFKATRDKAPQHAPAKPSTSSGPQPITPATSPKPKRGPGPKHSKYRKAAAPVGATEREINANHVPVELPPARR